MADSRSYTPGEYYCSYIDRNEGRQVGFNGWKDLPETTIVVDEDLNNAYAFFHTSGGVAQQEHFVVFDDHRFEVGAAATDHTATPAETPLNARWDGCDRLGSPNARP